MIAVGYFHRTLIKELNLIIQAVNKVRVKNKDLYKPVFHAVVILSIQPQEVA